MRELNAPYDSDEHVGGAVHIVLGGLEEFHDSGANERQAGQMSAVNRLKRYRLPKVHVFVDPIIF